MLDMKRSAESTEVVRTAILTITENRSYQYAETKATISATVNYKKVIAEKIFNISLKYDGANYADINIFWEDSGYANFKSLGLFGYMSTKYQLVESSGDKAFRVRDENDTYEIEVEY